MRQANHTPLDQHNTPRTTQVALEAPMRRARFMLHLTAALIALSLLFGMGSCGTTRAHFGVDHDVAYNWNGGYYEDGGHHHHKPPKPPKKKKPKKPKKHKKSKKHHHDD